jgi:broad specificity phosphatase PhoE
VADLFLVRHAQASFGTDDYDRLSELGHRQARWLGEYFAERGVAFDRVFTGSLRRHRETLAGITAAGVSAVPAQVHDGLDEYRSERLLEGWAAHSDRPAPARDADRREHFKAMREALAAWIDGAAEFPGHPTFARFAEQARDALRAATADAGCSSVLVVSSGGPISTLIAHVLEAAPRTVIDLNLQMRNASFCEFHFNARGVRCVSLNNVPHLDRPGRREHVTFA